MQSWCCCVEHSPLQGMLHITNFLWDRSVYCVHWVIFLYMATLLDWQNTQFPWTSFPLPHIKARIEDYLYYFSFNVLHGFFLWIAVMPWNWASKIFFFGGMIVWFELCLDVLRPYCATISMQHIANLACNNKLVLPVPAFNVINGGSHAGNKLAMQVFLFSPLSFIF